MVHLWTGTSGSGKTKTMTQHIVAISESLPSDETILLIVPEQSTLILQKEVLMAHPRHCLGPIEVQSFGRLAYRYGDALGIAGKTMLSDMGKIMLIKQLIQSDMNAYPFLSKHLHKNGYLEALKNLMSEFSRYQMDVAKLSQALEALPKGLLAMKMKECGRLYEQYMEAVSGRYLSGETIMERLLARIEEIQALKGVHLYIDGFYGFTPVQYHLISKLMQVVKSCHITFTIDDDSLKKTRLHENDLYYEPHHTYGRIAQIISEMPMLEVERRHFTKALSNPITEHIKKNLFQYPYKPYDRPSKGLYRFRCQGMAQELDYLADTIGNLVVHKGYRYRDIAVIVPDLTMYQRALTNQLNLYQFPFFIDGKKQLASNRGSHFVVNILSIYAMNFSKDHMMAFLKSTFVKVDSEVVDHLENYIHRYNIQGYKKWSKEWTYAMPDVRVGRDDPFHRHQLSAINALREQVMAWLTPFMIQGKTTMKDHMKRLYDLLVYFKLEEQLKQLADQYTKEGYPVRAREYHQIFHKLVQLLDQMCQVTTDEKLSDREVLKLLEAGIGEISLGLVPAGIDEILVGDMVRTRMPDKKILFVLGMNEGLVPMLREGKGLISDQERESLGLLGIDLAPGAMSNLYREQFYIYLALLKAKERLYISHTTTNEEGKASRPAHIWHLLGKLFPDNQVLHMDKVYDCRSPHYQVAVSYKRLMKAMSLGQNVDQAFLKWLGGQPSYHEKLQIALKGQQPAKLKMKLSKESAKELFGEAITTSVTRLEQFTRCPFAHYINYGLGAKEREPYEISMPQLGMIFHKVIEMFFKRLTTRQMGWEDITEALRSEWVEELVMIALKDEGYEVFYDNARNQHRINRLKAMLSRALWAIRYQILKGDFRPVASEWQFYGEQNSLKSTHYQLSDDKYLYLKGVIDRVDTFMGDEMAYVTIVDYKSSTHKVNLDEVYHGLSLQLIVYLNAACELVEKQKGVPVQPAGVFYFKIDDPYIQAASAGDQEAVMNEQLKALALKGIVLEDHQIIDRLDRAFTKQSTVIPVGRKKDESLTSNSDTLSKEGFELVQKYVHEKVGQLGSRLYEGDVSIAPIRHKTETACDHCRYSSICRFDERLPGHGYNELKHMDKEEVLAAIGNSGNEGETN